MSQEAASSAELKQLFAEMTAQHLAENRRETQATLESWKSSMMDAQQKLLTEIQKQQQQAAAAAASASGGSSVSASATASAAKVGLDALNAAITDSAASRSRIAEDMRASYEQQMNVLRAAIAEERAAASKAQIQFENTLQTKYDNMVNALREKIAYEHEARMKRSLEELEKSAVNESVRAKQAFELQQAAESGINAKFKALVMDLRKNWEAEEVARTKQLEDRLRSHYTAVLHHMEVQLSMALRLQDDADRQWMEDVEARNAQQVATLKAFEAKCRRLYDGRLADYIAQTNRQLNEYEEELLKMGNTVAVERAANESRVRRLRLSCSKWKVQYQQELHAQYSNMTAALEAKYTAEIQAVCEQLRTASVNLATTQNAVAAKEKELRDEQLKMGLVMRHQQANSVGTNGSRGSGNAVGRMKETLQSLWATLETPMEVRVNTLLELLDSVEGGPNGPGYAYGAASVATTESGVAQLQQLSLTNLSSSFIAKYNAVEAKLNARVPIAKLIMRRQVIELRLKSLGASDNTDGGNASSRASERAALVAELENVDSLIMVSMRSYTAEHGEPYHYAGAASTTSSGSSNTPSRSTLSSGSAASSGMGSGSKLLSMSGSRRPTAPIQLSSPTLPTHNPKQ